MIDIPSGSTPAALTGTTKSSTSADSLSAAVLSKLEAVVQVVKVSAESGQLEKPAWDILLKLNPGASNIPAAPSTSITPDLMRTLQTGQAILLQTQSSQLIPTGTRLQVNVSSAQGVQIQQVQLADVLPAQQLAQLKQWIPRQQAVLPLLANLLHLLQQQHQTQLTALPLRVQLAIQQVIAALPDPATVRNPGQLQSLVENSGILQEAKIAQALQQTAQEVRAGTPSKSINAATSAENAASSAQNSALKAPAVTTTLNQLSQQLKDWMQRLQPASGEHSATAQTPQIKNRTAADTSPLHKLLHQDLKQSLQQLEKHLQTASETIPSSGAAKENLPAGKSAVAPNAPGNENTEDANVTAPKKTPQSVENVRRGDTPQTSQSHSPTTPEPAQAKSPLAIQRYQASAQSGASKPIHNDANGVPDLIPLLPGQIVVQAQPRAKASLKQGDMADAIVKTLLSQVRGALARVTSHQLSSHSSRQESASPTNLSFEIPFLHNGQVELFQFRVQEEAESTDEKTGKQLGKRWTVQMGFDIEGLGPMFCQLSLTGKSMAVNFWAAWEQTLSSTKAHFSFLEQALQGMGIRVEKIQAQLGMPEADKTGVRNQLVDIKT